MLAIAADIFIILLIGVTTGIAISLHDEKIRSKVFQSIVTISNYFIEVNKVQLQQIVLSFASFIDAITQLISGKQKTVEAKRAGSIVKVPLKFMGTNYDLLVPYDSTLAREMRSYYTLKDGTKTPFSQPPGIPILVTSKDLDVDEIKWDDTDEVSF